MEHAAVLDDVAVELLRREPRVCAGLAGKREGALAVLGEGHEGEGGEVVGVHDQAITVDVVGHERCPQELAMHVLAHLADEGGRHAQALQGNEHVGGRATRSALEELLACGGGARIGEVDEQLAEGGNGEHGNSLLAAVPPRSLSCTVTHARRGRPPCSRPRQRYLEEPDEHMLDRGATSECR